MYVHQLETEQNVFIYEENYTSLSLLGMIASLRPYSDHDKENICTRSRFLCPFSHGNGGDETAYLNRIFRPWNIRYILRVPQLIIKTEIQTLQRFVEIITLLFCYLNNGIFGKVPSV